MDLSQERPLSELIAQKALSLQDNLEIIRQACAALQDVHDMGVVCGGITPSNIMVARTERGQWSVRIADATDVVGASAYTSPEEREGQTPDRRSDLYSLGCVLFEMLTGRVPSAVDSQIVMTSGLPKEVETVVRRAVVRSPEGRYQSAKEFGQDVADALIRKPTAQQKPANKRLRAAGIAVAALVCLGIAGVALSGIFGGANLGTDPVKTYEAAIRAFDAQNYVEAEKLYRRTTELSPDNPDAWWGLGEAQVRQEKDSMAIESLSKAVSINPNLAGAWHALSLCYTRVGQQNLAYDTAKRAAELEPNNPATLLDYGAAAGTLGHFGEAEEALDKCLRLDPSNVDAKEWYDRIKKARHVLIR